MQNRRAAISRRFRFSQPRRRRHDGRPRGGRRRGFTGPIRLRNGRPAAENVAAGRLVGRIPVRDQRPGPASGIAARNGLNKGVEDGTGAAGAAVLNEGGETAVRKSSMPPRYGSAQSGGSCGTSYVDNGNSGNGNGNSGQGFRQCRESAGRSPAGGRRQPGRCLSWPRRRARGWPRELQEPGKPCCPWCRANRSGRSRSP